METKEAKYMLAIAKHKSINKAAKALYISQPSLSKYLQNLEYRLDTKLFQHIQNEYIPTKTGERYLSYAKKLINIENEWNNEFHDIQNLKKGHLHIIIPMLRSVYLIPETISLFHERYPEITVQVDEVSHFVEKYIQEQDVDLAIYNVNQLPQNLSYHIISHNEIVLLVPHDHPLTKKAKIKKGFKYPWIDINNLKDESFIFLHNKQTSQKAIENIFKASNIQPHVWMRTRNSQVAIRMVEKGQGLTFISDAYIQNMPPERFACLSVGDQPIQTTLIVAYKKGQYITKNMQNYLDILKETYSSNASSFQ